MSKNFKILNAPQAVKTLPAHENCNHRQYGLTCHDYEAMLTATEQRCEICRSPALHNTARKLFIDHDDAVGKWAVRGLLCHRCNSLIANRPGWNVTAPDGADDYLANPWYRRRLVELGLSVDPPPEPLLTEQVLDPFGRTWVHAWGQWRTRGGRMRGRKWAGVVDQFGPIGLTVITDIPRRRSLLSPSS